VTDEMLMRAATAVRNLIDQCPAGQWASWVAPFLERAAEESRNQERWKTEALTVMDECYEVLEAAGHGALVGRSKAKHVAEYLRRSVLVDRIAGSQRDDRCCGDHPGDWNRPAVPGSSWCQECLDRIGGES